MALDDESCSSVKFRPQSLQLSVACFADAEKSHDAFWCIVDTIPNRVKINFDGAGLHEALVDEET